MKHILCPLLLCLFLGAVFAAEVRVTNAVSSPHWPWDGRIDITYSLECDIQDAKMSVSFVGYDKVLEKEVPMTTLTGDGAGECLPVGGPYTTTWEFTTDYPEGHHSDLVVRIESAVASFPLVVDGVSQQKLPGETVSITAAEKENKVFVGWWNISGVTGIENIRSKTISFTMPANAVSLDSYYHNSGEYLVVNLETGENRVTTNSPDLTDDTCRTKELWLRKIPKGTFTMGSPENEVGRYTNENQHQVTLTEDYYIGVFEVTQRQYELITGKKPSYFNNVECYAGRPVEQVTYDMIRGSSMGACWPSSHDVDDDSFVGILRDKTSLTFELPTEAQWEYACRAGAITSLNTGKNVVNATSSDANLNEVGRNWYNGGSSYSYTCDTSAGTAKVGSYFPNAWGIYDMHGNVLEWCLDWYGSYSGDATDPAGAQTGSARVVRGGGWGSSYPQDTRSAYRSRNPSSGYSIGGFRVVCLP